MADSGGLVQGLVSSLRPAARAERDLHPQPAPVGAADGRSAGRGGGAAAGTSISCWLLCSTTFRKYPFSCSPPPPPTSGRDGAPAPLMHLVSHSTQIEPAPRPAELFVLLRSETASSSSQVRGGLLRQGPWSCQQRSRAPEPPTHSVSFHVPSPVRAPGHCLVHLRDASARLRLPPFALMFSGTVAPPFADGVLPLAAAPAHVPTQKEILATETKRQREGRALPS